MTTANQTALQSDEKASQDALQGLQPICLLPCTMYTSLYYTGDTTPHFRSIFATLAKLGSTLPILKSEAYIWQGKGFEH